MKSLPTHPLQSPEWGAFRQEWGNQVVRIDDYQITLHKLPGLPFKIGAFIKGPIPDKQMITSLAALAKKERLIFIKLEPHVKKVDGKAAIALLKSAGAVRGKTLFTPETFWIDLSETEEELMKSFHPKTRYNIRLAERKGVTVQEDNSQKAFEKYWKLTKETTKRQGFFAHTKHYHELLWKHLHINLVSEGKQPIARILTAKLKNEVLTTWMLFVYNNILYYPYGASSDTQKQVMAPNLMMWEAIRYGRANECSTFDLWGREPGKGFTKFKEGYNPEVVEFIGTWDIVYSPLYWPYRAAEWLRWKILRLKAKLKK